MSCKTTVTEEGIKIMTVDNLNEIKGGSVNGQDAWVIYDQFGGSIAEMNSSVAACIDYSIMFGSVFVEGLWDKTQTYEEIEENIGGKLNEKARQALLSANIRGVRVVLYFHKEEMERKAEFAMRIKNHIDRLPQKEFEKVMKILNKYDY